MLRNRLLSCQCLEKGNLMPVIELCSKKISMLPNQNLSLKTKKVIEMVTLKAVNLSKRFAPVILYADNESITKTNSNLPG